MPAQLCQFDVGTNIDVRLVQRNVDGKLVPVDLDPIDDTIKYVFIFASGIRKEFNGFVVDGPLGVVRYTTLLNDIQEFELAKLQLQVIRDVPSQNLCTRIVVLKIIKKL